MKNSLIFIIIFFLAYGCCTKKDCDQEDNPEIIVRLDGFNNSDLFKISIILIDTSSFEKVDSITFYDKSNIFQIYNWILGNKKIEIKDYSYIIKTNVSEDTIVHVYYEKYSETIQCNSCFPFGDGSATVINYRGFSFRQGQIEHNGKDTLVIKNNAAN